MLFLREYNSEVGFSGFKYQDTEVSQVIAEILFICLERKQKIVDGLIKKKILEPFWNKIP